MIGPDLYRYILDRLEADALRERANPTPIEEKQPMKHEDFWIENTGVCPVPRGTMVDVKYAGAPTAYGTRALVHGDKARRGNPAWAMDWSLDLTFGRITHWRPSDLSAWIEGPLRANQLPVGTRVECHHPRFGNTVFNTSDWGDMTRNQWRLVTPEPTAAMPISEPPKRPLLAMFPPNAWVYRADGETFPNGYWFAQVTGSHEHKGETIVQLDGTSSLPRHKLCMYKTGTTSPKADVAKAHSKALGVYWRHGEDRPHILYEIKQKQKVQDRIAELKQELADLEASV